MSKCCKSCKCDEFDYCYQTNMAPNMGPYMGPAMQNCGGFGGNNIWWIIIILIFFCGNGFRGRNNCC